MRPFQTAFPKDFLVGYQNGVMRYRYKGVRCLKSPIDLAIYMHVLWQMKPATVIEIGTHSGGSALWIADMLAAFGLKTPVITIDLKVPTGIHDHRIRFLHGDVHNLGAVFDVHDLGALPRPWLVTEDSAHTFAACAAALDYLSGTMARGDLLIMEDGNLDEMGLSDDYDGGPNRAIAAFMEARPGVFQVETALCDMFGLNATYAPNGYLRKT